MALEVTPERYIRSTLTAQATPYCMTFKAAKTPNRWASSLLIPPAPSMEQL